MNIILLGYPGSGKGTQAKVLAQKLGLLHFSTGDIFREEIFKKSPLGIETAGYLSSGRLVPDRLVLDLIKSRLATQTRGLLFDGFPRTVEQAQALDDYFDSRSLSVDRVVFLDLPEQEVVSRLEVRLDVLHRGGFLYQPGRLVAAGLVHQRLPGLVHCDIRVFVP